MRSTRLSLAIVAGLGMTFGAAAQTAPTTESIVEFFAKSANLGAARGICIGTAQECNADLPKPVGMDMMINFELDSADLTTEARSNLEQFAKALQDERLRAARFMVEGHTDATGSVNYNDTLSERRAKAVTSFLLEQGVKPEKLTAVGLGMSAPRTDDPFDPVNRRVEMRINLQ